MLFLKLAFIGRTRALEYDLALLESFPAPLQFDVLGDATSACS